MNEGRAPSVREAEQKARKADWFTGGEEGGCTKRGWRPVSVSVWSKTCNQLTGACIYCVHLLLKLMMCTYKDSLCSCLFFHQTQRSFLSACSMCCCSECQALIMSPDVPQTECVITAFLSGFHCVKGGSFFSGWGQDTNCRNSLVIRSSVRQLRSLFTVLGLPCLTFNALIAHYQITSFQSSSIWTLSGVHLPKTGRFHAFVSLHCSTVRSLSLAFYSSR